MSLNGLKIKLTKHVNPLKFSDPLSQLCGSLRKKLQRDAERLHRESRNSCLPLRN